MKRFDDLSEVEKEKAMQAATSIIIENLIGGVSDFPNKKLHFRAMNIILKNEENETPWFAGQDLFADEILNPEILLLVQPIVRAAFYPEKDDYVIDYICSS